MVTSARVFQVERERGPEKGREVEEAEEGEEEDGEEVERGRGGKMETKS